MSASAVSPSDWAFPPLALTMGDPAGVGLQIAIEAWRQRESLNAPFVLIAPPAQVEATVREMNAVCETVVVENPMDCVARFSQHLPIVSIGGDVVHSGVPTQDAAPTIISSIEQSVSLCRDGRCSAAVTNPINKSLLYASGFQFPGHTEFLADLACRYYELAEPPRPVMMLVGGGLRVALATIHAPLRQVPDLLSEDLIIDICKIVHSDLQTRFGIKDPRLALAGLNPHAGEDGALGQEELTVINPAAKRLRDMGLHVSDARPGDTVFHEMLSGGHDVVIAMYHDQGLAPLKTLAMWDGVNTTLGLPFIRTSPDHGTAYDAARQFSARPDSLIAALNLAADMVVRNETPKP